MRPGTHVEIRSRFEGRWSRGFAIVSVEEGGAGGEDAYTVRRRSDDSVLPVTFTRDDLREERRRGTWWI